MARPDFEYVHEFSEGLASVIHGGKWGFIDHSGQMVIEAAAA
ncbi:MAG: WG repeat-containing protein [Thermoleophilia bacterium]